MGKCTWSAVQAAVRHAVLSGGYDVESMFDDMKKCPYDCIAATFEATVASGDKTFFIPMHISFDKTCVIKAVIMEIAVQLHKFGDLYVYGDKKLEFSDMRIRIVSAYSRLNDGFAIYHKEQECGSSWLCVCAGDMYAPITYEADCMSEGNKIVRSETNRVILL